MNKNSNTYIILYSTVMVVIVAVLLAYASLSLADRQNANIAVEKQGAILGSMGLAQDAGKAQDKTLYIQEEYAKYITDAYVVNGLGERVEGVDAFGLLDVLKSEFKKSNPAEQRLPVFEASLEDGSGLAVLPIYGAGLWGPVWGYIALEGDWNTVYGAKFDHKSETPGLGAEIATPNFENQFKGKTIFRDGKFVGVSVKKGQGTSAGNPNAVDAISGGTITSRAVQEMIISCLGSYLPLIEKKQAPEPEQPADESINAEEENI